MAEKRYNSPIALLQERFVIVMGGMGQYHMPITSTEGFDTVKLKWFKMQHLEKPRCATSAVVMNN
jgi:hypothetical protein